MKLKFWDVVAGVLLAAAFVLLGGAFTKDGSAGDVAGVARRVERVLEKRLAKLDTHVQAVLEQAREVAADENERKLRLARIALV